MRLRLLAIILGFTSTLLSQNYHDTQGKLEISNAGQATYTLPIAMPPSVKNVGPVINLTYASGQNGGVAGQGWNISAISNISRIATRKDIDGFVDGVDFDDNDKLALDGQRLILKTGTYWGDGSTYETEVQSNTKIELRGSGAFTYFIVTSPDGSRTWYGNYSGSYAYDLTAFYISRFEDTNGNFINYKYIYPLGNVICIDEILFSANQSALPINSIKFNYKTAARKESTYIKLVKQEKEMLLDNIEVKTNSQLFKKYVVTYFSQDDYGYERVKQIQEFNGALEVSNPVLFEYNTTPNNADIIPKSYVNNLNFESVGLTGDFDGDGSLDFTRFQQVYTKLFQGGVGQQPLVIPDGLFGFFGYTFVANTVVNSKLNQSQSLVRPSEVPNGIEFKIYDLVANSVNFTRSKTALFNRSTFQTMNNGLNTNFLEGDFNGDGTTDVLISSRQTEVYDTDPLSPCNIAYQDCVNNSSNGGEDCISTCEIQYQNNLYFFDLNSNTPNVPGSSGLVRMDYIDPVSGLITFPFFNNHDPQSFFKTYVMDFNGDGKSDVVNIGNDKSYTIYSLKEMIEAPWMKFEIIGKGVMPAYEINKPLLFGDYNGDGKVDIMTPEGLESPNWIIYYSNPSPIGGSFFTVESKYITPYHPTQSGNNYEDRTSYHVMDVNKDGKTDLVSFFKTRYRNVWYTNDYDTDWQVKAYTNNIGKISNNGFTNTYDSGLLTSGEEIPPFIITSNFKYQGLNTDLVLIKPQNNKIDYYRFNKNFTIDNQLKKVTSSGGNIVDEIEYKTMEPDGTGFYTSSNSSNYPFVEIGKLPTNYLVSKIKNSADGITKYQDFYYNGFVVNLHGLGVIGFNKTARSAWYQNPSANRLWNVNENNPLLRGATIRGYSQFVTPGNNFAFVSNGNPTGIINSTTTDFSANSLNNIYRIYMNNQITTDYITGVSNRTDYTYDPTYLLPTKTIATNYLNNVLQGTTTTINTFDSNPNGTTNYYIGRPVTSTTATSAYGDTFETKDEFYYTNNRLTKTKKRGNTLDALYLVEDYMYDVFGNVTKKTVSSEGYTGNVINPRSTEYTYDASGRFITSVKDVEGLVSTNTAFHPLYGIVTSTTNPFGLTTTTELDNWGKVKKVTDFLGKSINYTYAKAGTEYTVTKTGDDGSSSVAISDALGRPKKAGSKNIDGTWSYKNIEYDFLGRKYKESEPYTSGSPTLWNTSAFDDYGRLITSTTSTGLTTNITYTGTTVTGNDGFKTTSSTKNANGHVVAASDNGGTINYTYYANGNLKTTNFEGTIISMKYDEWGRKIEMTDPSAGTYNYTYYPTGELKTEVTPKGTTTFNLNLVTGKLNEKTIVGDLTNTKTTYTYDTTSKLLLSNKFEDILNNEEINNTYEYDTYKRIKTATESKNLAFFQTVTTYDDFGRVEKELYTAISAGFVIRSVRQIKHTYKNGFHYQILDDATAKVLWQTNTVNARGQLTGAVYGNGIVTSNTYNQYGYNTQLKHDTGAATPANVMTLGYVYNTQRGLLNSRSNNMFNYNETFKYDSLERLTEFTNALGQQETQVYDNKGRITQNNMGNYKYTNSAKAYQNTSVELNSSDFAYYTNREGLFNDTMESQSGWDNASFGYWAHQGTGIYTFDTARSYTGNVSTKVLSNKYIHMDKWIPINNTVDTQYTFSGWVYTDNPTAQLTLFMRKAAETNYFTNVQSVSTATKAKWVYITKTVLVPANIKKLNLRLDNLGAGNVWFDDVRIKKTTDSSPPNKELNISYNTFKSPVEIEETGVDKISFTYNDGNDRSSIYYGSLDVNKLSRPYRKHYSASGIMEIKQNNVTGAVEFVTYIGGDAYTAPIVLKSDGTNQEYLYLHRDNQGSIMAVTNDAAQIVEKRLFDAWGNIAKVQDGQGNNLFGLTILDRGYTGHEHLQSVGLIHMNGRLYDPKLHRFLQPDNFVQEPYNTQNYNRYGYVFNNPLKYTDPSGEYGVGAAIVIGAIIAATTYTVGALMNNSFDFRGLIQASFMGAFSGAVTFGIGSAVNGVAQFGLKLTYQALAHGTFQGMMTGLQGGNFWNGFAAGALSSITSSLWQGGDLAKGGHWNGISGAGANYYGTLTFGAISGGAGAALSGGNFWEGAVTGLFVSGLNHVAHEFFTRKYNVIALHDYEAANGFGHDSVAFELEDGKLFHVSKDGTGSNGGIYGKSKTTIGVFNSIEEINDYYALNHEGKRYDIIGVYKATREQINKGIVAALNVAKTNYCLVGNSCTDVLTFSLNAVFGYSFKLTLRSPVPNINFFTQASFYNSNFTDYKLLK